MKLKVFSVVLILCLSMTAGLAVVQAAGPELLSNPGFESGVSPWNAMGSGIVVDATYAHSGTKGCRVYNRTSAQSCVVQDVKAFVKHYSRIYLF